MKSWLPFLILFSIVTATFVQGFYVDPMDKRYPDQNKYVDIQDPRVNKNEPAVYNDPLDPRFIPFTSINGVQPLGGNIVFYSSDGSVTILPDYLSSRINLMVQSGGGDSNGVTWAEIAALFPVPDENLSSLSWTKLLNYPVGCGADEAVQVIGDTLTCIDVISEADANGFYLKLYSATTQIVTGGVANIVDWNGNLNPLITNTWGLGRIARRWGPSYINQITTSPGNGMPAIYVPANTSFACAVNTDSCLDYNGTRWIGITDQNMIDHLWGTTGSAGGLYYHRPVSAPPTLGSGAAVPDGANYNVIQDTNNWFYQPQVLRNGIWQHEDARSYYGIPKDGVIDRNSSGDENNSGNTIHDGNFLFDRGADSNGTNLYTADANFFIDNDDLNGAIVFYKTVNNTQVQAARFHKDGTNVNVPFFTGTLGCGLDSTFSGELFCQASLSSLKLNIEDLNRVIDPSILYLLQPKLFNGIENPTGHKVAGLIAEEVLQAAPFFVTYDETGLMRGVDYKGLNILTISALQNEHQKVLKLESQVADLNAQLAVFKQGFCVQFPFNPSCVVVPG